MGDLHPRPDVPRTVLIRAVRATCNHFNGSNTAYPVYCAEGHLPAVLGRVRGAADVQLVFPSFAVSEGFG